MWLNLNLGYCYAPLCLGMVMYVSFKQRKLNFESRIKMNHSIDMDRYIDIWIEYRYIDMT